MWKKLTKTDLLSALNSAESAGYNAAVTGEIDPADEIVRTTTHEVRGYVAANSSNRLAAGETVPERVEHHALAIIRFRVLSRLDVPISDARTLEYKDARDYFKQVAAGKVAIDRAPEAETDATPAPGSEIELLGGGAEPMSRDGLNQL